MSKLDSTQKVLIIGSGPIVINQAVEFDYAGTQACRTLRGGGAEITLVNSSPTAIMIDGEIADKVYIEPLITDTLKKVILKERPDSVLPALGGQNVLNFAVELEGSGFLVKYNVRMISINTDIIRMAEDHELFEKATARIQQSCAESETAGTMEDNLLIVKHIGYPVMVRLVHTLGGSDDDIAYMEEQLHAAASMGLRRGRVSQVLTEYCISGWKEIEYEVVRGGNGNRIATCNTESFDPVGVYTSDSIVVVPCQTPTDKEIQMLHSMSITITNELKVEGGCDVQSALNPEGFEHYVVEVNPRVSRSSALVSEAADYPIVRVASKIALGYTLDEIQNVTTKKTYTCFEPMLDCCVMKISKWPFDKFVHIRRSPGTQMKATGEVMSIAPTSEAVPMRSIRCLEQNMYDPTNAELGGLSDLDVSECIHAVDNRRLFAVAETLHRGFVMEKTHSITKIDRWFLQELQFIIAVEKYLANEPMSGELLLKARLFDFLDKTIAKLFSINIEEICGLKKGWVIRPAYETVDICAVEFEAEVPYYYSSYGDGNESHHESGRKKIMVIGSSPIRIGQGIESDFCSVHNVWALKKLDFEAIIMNNNPEAISTDFGIVDKLYFGLLTPEDAWHIVELEKPDGAVVQLGGQTAIKLTDATKKMGISLLGTDFDNTNEAEDRECFDTILAKYGIPYAAGHMVFTCDEALRVAHKLGYPVLVYPPYVLGGQGVDIAHNDDSIREQIDIINTIVQEHPILMDKYLMGIGVEVDAVCDGIGTLISGIMQHVERAGVHSDDSISVYPAQSLSKQVEDTIVDYTRRLALAPRVKGL